MFEDLKVLELASVLAGPAVGQFFAELGAQVVKVENLKTKGDVTRTWKTAHENTDDRSSYFSAINWGKKSIAVNLETPEGRAIVHSLAAQSDVVIGSYKPGDAERLGVDYQILKKLNPRLIYGQITGYGSHDPRVGYDAVVQAEAGFMFMNGEPGKTSLKMPVALMDLLAAHHLKEAILLAMIKLNKTGEGGFTEVSLIQSAISSLANQATNWLIGNKIPQKQGSAHPNIAPYGDVFVSADAEEILLAVGSDKQFEDLCDALNIPKTRNDPKFASNSSRVKNRVFLHFVLQEAIKAHDAEPLIAKFHQLRIPAAMIQNLQQVFETPAAQELLYKSSDRTGVRTFVANPLPSMPPHFLPPPHVGEHTIEILRNVLKMEAHEVQELTEKGIIQ